MNHKQLVNNNILFVMIDILRSSMDKILASVETILMQTNPNWEIILISNYADSILLDNKKIKIYKPNLEHDFFQSANAVINKCTSQYIIFLQSGDKVSLNAINILSQYCNKKPLPRLIVADEDELTNDGRRVNPCFKPNWNPDYLASFNYFLKGVIYESKLLKELGGFNPDVKDPYHDLALRATQRLDDDQIAHISQVLFHFKQSDIKKTYRNKFDLPSFYPLVSIIIPTKDQLDLLKNCIDSILNKTRYKNYEIIIIDNKSKEYITKQYLKNLQERYSNIKILQYNKKFNYSDMNNFAVANAKGSILVFLNNDISVIGKEGVGNSNTINEKDDWLTEMVSQACRPEIGCVGAKLLYPDGTIQHAGVILGLKGSASHAHKHFPKDHSGYFNRLIVPHNVSAVTAACLVMRKRLFEEVDGFDAVNLKVAYNDVDLCLKVLALGYRNLWTPYAELIHHESKTRGKKRSWWQRRKLRKETRFLQKKWGELLQNDPCYNPNLTLRREDFSIKDHDE